MATLSPSLRVLLVLAAATIALAGVYFVRDVFGPVALAIIIVIICDPLRRPLDRRGWPRWARTTAVIFLAYLIVLAMAAHQVCPYSNATRGNMTSRSPSPTTDPEDRDHHACTA